MQFLSSQRVLIEHDVWGIGRPVLLVHGFASNARVNWINTSWTKTLEQAGYAPITFDNRGHGRSSKFYEPECYSIELMADDAKQLLDHLGHDRVSIMGYSMGARIAAAFANRYPSVVVALVLAGLAENLMADTSNAEAIATALEAGSVEKVTDPVVRGYRVFAEQTGSDRQALAACIRGSRRKIGGDELQGIRAPVLVVAGSEDKIAGPVAPLVDKLPNAEGLVLPRRDHMQAVGDRTFKQGVVKFFDKHAA
jgi:pimeloyl-ACP methyl ester carboxylesterase